NGSMSSNQSGEGEIRKDIVEADLVDCMVALPGQLFYSTQIPVCLWFLARNKRNGRFRDRWTRPHAIPPDVRMRFSDRSQWAVDPLHRGRKDTGARETAIHPT